jgi:hypothetical protein
MLKTICFTLAACVAGSAVAQSTARPDPAESKAAAPAPAYDSAFKDYRPYVDPEIARWREVNQEVGRLKGHVGNVGHVPQQPGAAAKPAAKPPAQGGHGAHK